ncbi:ABC transporter permease [Natronoarchaeum sp. GCM10025321]|uniref:ABC transporter permease n=1 Tax=Natronoarchaeum sp. GCM10025321 TaxID=3252684 RepID=UPI0036201092
MASEGASRRATGLTRRGYQWVRERSLPIAALVAGMVLLVVFYFPVAVVFLEGVVVDGLPSLAPLREVLTDPFYVGVLADVFARPTATGEHLDSLLRWAATGFARPSLGLIGFTAYQAVLSTVASVAIGLPGAYILARYEFRGRRLLRSLTILPFVLPGIMVAIGFFAMFSTNGPLNALLGVFGVAPVEMLFTLEIIVLAHAFYNAPLVARLATAAWEGVDARTVETARSLGASRRRAFFDVLAPQLAPAVLAGTVLTFVFTFRTFPIVLALGGLEMATIEVWIFSRIQQLDLTTAAALAIVETVISIGVLALYLRFESRQYGAGQAPTQIDREPLLPSFRALFRPSRVAISVYGVFVAVLFIGPMVSMIAESLTGPNGLTLSHYAFLFDRQSGGTAFQIKPWPAVRNSLLFAGATLAIALPTGIVVAVRRVRGDRGGVLLDVLATAPLAVSGIVLGIGLLRGLVFGLPLPGGWRLQVTGGVAIVAAHAAATYPFVVRNVAPAIGRVDLSLVESARALGASRVRAMVDVELPLAVAGIVAGAAFAVAISIGEFNSTVILAEGGDYYTMPVAVERYLGDRTLGPATAMGTVLLAVTSASFVVIDRVGGGRGDRL